MYRMHDDCDGDVSDVAVNGEDGQYITVIFDTPEEAQMWVVIYTIKCCCSLFTISTLFCIFNVTVDNTDLPSVLWHGFGWVSQKAVLAVNDLSPVITSGVHMGSLA